MFSKFIAIKRGVIKSEVQYGKRKLIEHQRSIASVGGVMLICLVLGTTNLFAATSSNEPAINQDLLNAVTELYGISEEQAIDRLARESEAAIAWKLLQEFPIKSYAGSWFDETSLQLNVAIADSSDLKYLKTLNVVPVHVKNSLVTLQNRLSTATEGLRLLESLDSAVIESYIDYRSNIAVLTLNKNHATSARSELSRMGLSGLIKIDEVTVLPQLSHGTHGNQGNVRGADGTRNLTWANGPWPCSIGVSIVGGYVTAGHCGYANNQMGDITGHSLGVVQNSTWEDSLPSGPSIDVGHVTTVAGWTPTPKVNGYNDGILSVSAEWAGILVSPIGSTVCRYGQTSGGPHCGTVNQYNVTVNFGHVVTGLTRLVGSCTSPGDSGGTYVSGAGQIQGTNVGGQPFSNGDICPTNFQYVYFQPIQDALDEYSATLLTVHGSASPTINQVDCPDMANSGSGSYHCLVTSIDSQGEIQLQWTTSTGASSTSPSLFGTCSNWEMVSVTLQATNSYGTSSKNYSFLCPTGWVP